MSRLPRLVCAVYGGSLSGRALGRTRGASRRTVGSGSARWPRGTEDVGRARGASARTRVDAGCSYKTRGASEDLRPSCCAMARTASAGRRPIGGSATDYWMAPRARLFRPVGEDVELARSRTGGSSRANSDWLHLPPLALGGRSAALKILALTRPPPVLLPTPGPQGLRSRGRNRHIRRR